MEIIGDHVVQAYSRIGLVIEVYVWISVSLFLPQEVTVNALYILMVLYALDFVYFMCAANVNLGSRVSPRIIGKGFVAMILLFILMFKDLECSAGSGVKRVDWVLLVFMIR